MEHKEHIRIVPGTETAVLFVHGVLGTPRHFDKFLPLVQENVSVHALLLPGHGKGVKDFSATSMKSWIGYVDEAVEQLLQSHKKVLIAAHSMGTLFAIQQAVKRPERIGGLFLLAAPLKLFIRPAMISNVAKVYLDRIRPDDYMALAAKRCNSITLDKRVWLYFGWIPRYLELFSQIRKTDKLVQKLRLPCWVFQSEKDEMVASRAQKILAKNPDVQVNVLPNSSHYYYEPADEAYFLARFRDFLERFA